MFVPSAPCNTINGVCCGRRPIARAYRHRQNACEVFVFCAALALGLLQLIALQFQTAVWQQHGWYLRTQSRALPSERTVKQVLAPRLLKQFVHLAQQGLIAKLQRGFESANDEEVPHVRLSA